MNTISRNAATARLGFRAEELLTKTPAVREAFVTYFKKPIVNISKAPHGKKSDIVLNFNDGTNTKIQNKNGDNQRGFSVDRRDYEDLTTLGAARTLISNVCLHKGTDRPEVGNDEAIKIINHSFLGDDVEWMPDYITHTQITDGNIVHLSIMSMVDFVNILKAEVFSEVIPKKTCVHLSPSIYLQRKGGGKTDKRPDQIQTKWRQGTTVDERFTRLI